MFKIFRLIKCTFALDNFHAGSRRLTVVQPIFVEQKKSKSCSSTAVAEGESHDERNIRLRRPQSPHLTIYKPQLTAMLSITQRATGIALSTYFMALGIGAILLPCDIPYYLNELECFQAGNIIISGLKFCLAFPLCYHFWNGLRHLVWDTGVLLSIPQVYATGYLMLLLAMSSAAVLACLCIEDEDEEQDKNDNEDEENY